AAAMSTPLCGWPGRCSPNGLVSTPLTGVAIRPDPQPPALVTGAVLTGTVVAAGAVPSFVPTSRAEISDGLPPPRARRGAATAPPLRIDFVVRSEAVRSGAAAGCDTVAVRSGAAAGCDTVTTRRPPPLTNETREWKSAVQG